MNVKIKDSNTNTSPIFIVGYPRSGTTLLQSMLYTQKNIYSFPETHFFTEILPLVIGKNSSNSIKKSQLSIVLKNIYLSNKKIEIPNKIFEVLDSINGEKKLSLKQVFDLFVHSFLIENHSEKELKGSFRWVEKTPGHIYHMDLIKSIYHKAKFIFIVRYPHNVIYSNIKNFSNYDFSNYKTYSKKWRNIFFTYNNFKDKYPKSIILTRYEDLIHHTSEEFNKICNFVNIIPDISLLKNTSSVSKNIVSQHEHWKKDNLEKSIKTKTFDYDWPVMKKLFISFLLRKEMLQLNYNSNIFDSLSQSRFMNFLISAIPISIKKRI